MRRRALTTVLTSLLLLTACSAAPHTATTAKPARAALPPHTGADAQAEVPPSASQSPLPPRLAPREAASPDPNFDYGFVVQITPAGFHPAWLLSGCCLPVTWRNLTDHAVSVVFDHKPISSGLIPPGGTFVFTPQHIESIAYHSGTDPAMTGVVQVNQTFES